MQAITSNDLSIRGDIIIRLYVHMKKANEGFSWPQWLNYLEGYGATAPDYDEVEFTNDEDYTYFILLHG